MFLCLKISPNKFLKRLQLFQARNTVIFHEVLRSENVTGSCKNVTGSESVQTGSKNEAGCKKCCCN